MVSVIIPAFNCAKWLPTSLNSLLNQSFKDWEALVVDDGSTDDTGKIADEFAANDSRITVVHQSNAGSSVARNVGLSWAKGEYVYMFDGDDYLHPDLLTIAVSALEHHPNAAFVTFDFLSVESSLGGGGGISVDEPSGCSEYVVENTLAFWLRNKTNTVWINVYRRSSLNGLKFEPGIKHQDLLFTYEYLKSNPCCVVVPRKLYYYVLTDGSIMRSPLTADRMKTIFYILTRLDEEYCNYPKGRHLLRRRLFPRIINIYMKKVLHETTGRDELSHVFEMCMLRFVKEGCIGFVDCLLSRKRRVFLSYIKFRWLAVS